MKNPTICKSECKTWYVIAIDDEGEYRVFYEGLRKKDCTMWLEKNSDINRLMAA